MPGLESGGSPRQRGKNGSSKEGHAVLQGQRLRLQGRLQVSGSEHLDCRKVQGLEGEVNINFLMGKLGSCP
jgi:hypothetical protein